MIAHYDAACGVRLLTFATTPRRDVPPGWSVFAYRACHAPTGASWVQYVGAPDRAAFLAALAEWDRDGGEWAYIEEPNESAGELPVGLGDWRDEPEDD